MRNGIRIEKETTIYQNKEWLRCALHPDDYTPVRVENRGGLMVKCGNCSSEDSSKVSHLYSASTKITTSKTKGGGIGISSFGSIGVGIGKASTNGTVQTVLAQQLTPPQKPSSKGLAINISIAFFIIHVAIIAPAIERITGTVSGGFSTLILLGGIGYIIYWASNKNKAKLAQYEASLAEWNKQWICNRCGNIFYPSTQ